MLYLCICSRSISFPPSDMQLKRPSSTLPTALKWRSETRNRDIAIQASTLLLHRRSDPFPLLKSLLPSPLPASLFLRILARTRSQPETSLRFFHFVRSELHFRPDIHSQSKLVQTLVDSDPDSAKLILHPLLQSEPAPVILSSLTRSANKDSQSTILNLILESYSNSQSIPNSLFVLSRIRVLDVAPSSRSCNALLNALCSSDWIWTSWICLGALVRTGFEPDGSTWLTLTRILCAQGKIQKAENLLKFGFCGVSSYNLVIDCYSKGGEFNAAIRVLRGMYAQSLNPGFSDYASVLDAGFEFGNLVVVGSILKEFIASGLLVVAPVLDYDSVICRFCDLGNTFAAEMFFKKARKEKVRLSSGTYRSILEVFSKNGREKKAMEAHRIMLTEDVLLDSACCDVFMSGVCKGEPSEEADTVLKDLIAKGSVPNASDISMYVDGQCRKSKWKEASDLLNVALAKGVLLDAFCCSSLVRWYCDNGLIESAIALHDKVKKSGGYLDGSSYNALLEALFSEKRSDEAIVVFDYMREKNAATSASFVIMVTSLCREKKMRKAMDLHDEMMRLGLKPDDATYKCLISGFM